MVRSHTNRIWPLLPTEKPWKGTSPRALRTFLSLPPRIELEGHCVLLGIIVASLSFPGVGTGIRRVGVGRTTALGNRRGVDGCVLRRRQVVTAETTITSAVRRSPQSAKSKGLLVYGYLATFMLEDWSTIA